MRRLSCLALPLLTWTALAAADKTTAALLRVIAWPVEGTAVLEASGLRAEAGGKAARVVRVRGPADDLLLLLIVDLTADLTVADQARQAAASSVEALPAATWVGVLRAQDGLQVLTDPGADHGAAVSAIQSIQVAGRAGTLEAVEPAARLAATILKKSPLRLAVLFVTDSSIYNYREDYTNPVINPSDSRDLSRRFPENLIREKTAKVAEQLAGYDAPIFIAHVAHSDDRLNEAYRNGLRQMAESTGGEAWYARTPAEIAATIGQAFERIQNHWSIDLELPAKLPKDFEVQIQNGGAGLQYRTHYRERRD